MLRAAIALGLLTFFPSSVTAGLVTWEFGGTVTFVSDSTGFLGGGVTLGSPFSLLYTFDSTTPDSSDDPGRGTYEDAITNLSGQVGDLAFLGPGVGDNFVSILDNLVGIDKYFSTSIVEVLDELGNLELAMADGSEFVFSDDSLPVVPPDLGSFDTLRFSVFSESVSFNVSGDLTFLVPEPTTLTLLAFAAAVVGRRMRLGDKS